MSTSAATGELRALRRRWRIWPLLAVLVALHGSGALEASAQDAPLRIYVDADRSGARAVGVSIERGLRLALGEVGDRLGGRAVEVVLLDHRGNTRRSMAHMRRFVADPDALLVMAGMHSPPLLAQRDFLNRHEVLVLDPWAAAAPITRPERGPNWIFRLSVDDTHAGRVIAAHALDARGLRRPALLLEDTAWGRNNERTMAATLRKRTGRSPEVYRFPWSISERAARELIRRIVASGADGILLVANGSEAATLLRALAQLPAEQRLPVSSHWGLSSALDTLDVLDRVDVWMLQTRFSFLWQPRSPLAESVLAAARRRWPDEIRSAEDLSAGLGLAHAYDLTRLLIAAGEQIEWTGDARVDRRRLREALERLDGPVPGLLRTYRSPFAPWSPQRADAHEALGADDLIMARVAPDGRVLVEPPPAATP